MAGVPGDGSDQYNAPFPMRAVPQERHRPSRTGIMRVGVWHCREIQQMGTVPTFFCMFGVFWGGTGAFLRSIVAAKSYCGRGAQESFQTSGRYACRDVHGAGGRRWNALPRRSSHPGGSARCPERRSSVSPDEGRAGRSNVCTGGSIFRGCVSNDTRGSLPYMCFP